MWAGEDIGLVLMVTGFDSAISAYSRSIYVGLEWFIEPDVLGLREEDPLRKVLSWLSRDPTNVLFSRGLIQSPSTGVVTDILDKMARMGLVARTRLWRSRGGRIYYRHLSPLLSIVYGVMERNALDELPVTPERVRGTLEMLLSREVSFSLGEMLSLYHKGIQAYTVLKGGGIDVVVLDKRGRTPIIAYEVKLGTCDSRDRRVLEERSKAVGIREARLLCLGGGGDLDARDVIAIAKDMIRERIMRSGGEAP